jgi:hypothetical protein
MFRTSIVTAVAVFLLAPPTSALAAYGPRDGKYAARVSSALESRCQPYRATGHDTATSPAGPYVGFDNITIGKTTYSNVPAVTDIIAPLTPDRDSGVLTTRTRHTIALPTGTITTTDNVHLIPTQTSGVYKLVSHLVITSGATGEIQLQGTLNLGTLSAEVIFVGTICGLN